MKVVMKGTMYNRKAWSNKDIPGESVPYDDKSIHLSRDDFGIVVRRNNSGPVVEVTKSCVDWGDYTKDFYLDSFAIHIFPKITDLQAGTVTYGLADNNYFFIIIKRDDVPIFKKTYSYPFYKSIERAYALNYTTNSDGDSINSPPSVGGTVLDRVSELFIQQELPYKRIKNSNLLKVSFGIYNDNDVELEMKVHGVLA